MEGDDGPGLPGPRLVEAGKGAEEPSPEKPVADGSPALDEEDVFEDWGEPSGEEPPLEEPHRDPETTEEEKAIEDAIANKPFHARSSNSLGIDYRIPFKQRFGDRSGLRAEGWDHNTEAVVRMGLCWLRNHQNADGTWSCVKFQANCRGGACTGPGATDVYDLGVSGLALLAFLGAGNTHKSGGFKDTLRRGLKALKDCQTADGCFGPKAADGRWIYNHILCAQAAAEAWGLANPSPLLFGMASRGIGFLLGCQNPGAGWGYGVKPGLSDTSVTAFAVLALRSASLSGFEVPQKSFDDALAWLDSVTDRDGRTGYRRRGDSGALYRRIGDAFLENEAMTAAGTASRIFILERADTEAPWIGRGCDRLKADPPRWDAEAGAIDLIYWYFGSLAMFQKGGESWSLWKERVKGSLSPTQRRDGCEDGSWNPVGPWGSSGGRVYATAISTLTLETGYRFARFGTE